MLVRLVFASRATDASNEAVEALLAGVRKNNTESGITSILCYGDGVFLQVLEGGREAVNRAFHRVANDARHSDVQILVFEEITERLFGGWTLGHTNVTRHNASLLLKYFETAQLNPYAVPGKAALALLEELQATASLVNRP
jgi:hypothetical protein